MLLSFLGGFATDEWILALGILCPLALLLYFSGWLINEHAKKRGRTSIPCQLCAFPHCDLLYPARRKGKKNLDSWGSFACSSCDHAQYPDIYYCPNCKNGFLQNIAGEQFVDTCERGNTLYKEVEDHEYLRNISARVDGYKRIAKRYEPYLTQKNVLEVGTYYGAFYQVIKDQVADYMAIEPSRHAGAYLKKTYPHLHLYSGRLEEAHAAGAIPKDHFDTIVLFDVLEHLPRPMESLAVLHEYLRPGGMIVYSTINIEASISLLLGPFWPWYMEMHYFYFSDRGYLDLFNRTGFRMQSHHHYRYSVKFYYLVNKAMSIFWENFQLPPWAQKMLDFRIPVMLGDSVLIVGQKLVPQVHQKKGGPSYEMRDPYGKVFGRMGDRAPKGADPGLGEHGR